MTYPDSGPSSTGLGGFGTKGSRGARNSISVSLEGLDKFRAKFKTYYAGVTMAGPSLAREFAEDIAETARDLAPFDPENTTEPHVRDSIHVRSAGTGAEVFVNRGGVRDEVPAYLEFGTFQMAARPFLAPAARMVVEAHGANAAARRIGGLLSPRGIRFEG